MPAGLITVNTSDSIAMGINSSYLDPSRYSIEFFGKISLPALGALLNANLSLSLPNDTAIRRQFPELDSALDPVINVTSNATDDFIEGVDIEEILRDRFTPGGGSLGGFRRM